MRFDFSTAHRILFGNGVSAEVPDLAAGLGHKALVVTGSEQRASGLIDGLVAKGISSVIFIVNSEPEIDQVLMAMRIYRQSQCDLAIGFGGGSVIDTGKAAIALAANPGNPLEYLEVVGTGRPLEHPPVPYIAIPTTPGTGSEVTRNAVIAAPEKRVKVSLRNPYLLPRIAVIDPELTYSLPPDITANTGMDALTQVIEPFVCSSPTLLTDAFCRTGIPKAGHSLLKAYQEGSNTSAREDMSLASLLGGMALANARLGAVHGLAGPLGGMIPAPHGSICAKLLPLVMEANVAALRSRQADSPALIRYTEIAALLTGNPAACAEDGIDFIYELCRKLTVCNLGDYGLKPEHYSDLITLAQNSSSMKGNPINLTNQELIGILERSR